MPRQVKVETMSETGRDGDRGKEGDAELITEERKGDGAFSFIKEEKGLEGFLEQR